MRKIKEEEHLRSRNIEKVREERTIKPPNGKGGKERKGNSATGIRSRKNEAGNGTVRVICHDLGRDDCCRRLWELKRGKKVTKAQGRQVRDRLHKRKAKGFWCERSDPSRRTSRRTNEMIRDKCLAGKGRWGGKGKPRTIAVGGGGGGGLVGGSGGCCCNARDVLTVDERTIGRRGGRKSLWVVEGKKDQELF